MWLLGDIALQGDSLDISLVHIIILSLVGSKHAIFFTNVPKGSHQRKKNYEILDIVQNSDDPPSPLGWYGRKKYGRLGRAQTPPPYRSLDILTLKV